MTTNKAVKPGGEKVRKIAETIARDLFNDGLGVHATHLAMFVNGEHTGLAYNERAIASRIEEHLVRALAGAVKGKK